ncbi:MAG: hypothetical protein PUE80_01595 [bacterium]|nr:hypothetical protein [bacterium]MDD6901495.1 hypothetical protein [bacterium]
MKKFIILSLIIFNFESIYASTTIDRDSAAVMERTIKNIPFDASHMHAKSFTMSARFMKAIVSIYGDSLLSKCLKEKEHVGILICMSKDNRVQNYQTYRGSRAVSNGLLGFIEKNKWKVLRKVLELYDDEFVTIQSTENYLIYFPIPLVGATLITRLEKNCPSQIVEKLIEQYQN